MSGGDLRDLYQEVILDHGKRPRNFRVIANATRQARGHNPLCGDQLTVYLALDDAGRVADVSFQGRGCAISMASASMMTELLKGKTEAEARHIFAVFHAKMTGQPPPDGPADQDAVDQLEVLSGVREFPMRVKCATLAWHAFTAALDGGDATARTE